MEYIIFDLEFNQDLNSLHISEALKQVCPFEIIQIGAIKIDSKLNAIATFNRYVKPSIYQQVNSFVSELTGITTTRLSHENTFPEVFRDFMLFTGEDCVFCTWGMSDMKELYRNVIFHELNQKELPEMVINLQPEASIYLKQSRNKLINLQAAVDALSIATPYQFHNALYDAYYTAQLFKKISGETLQPVKYIPDFHKVRPAKPKQIIDYEGLINQFTKMYGRELSPEEIEMIKLAYKMGRTHQFIK
ncbi:MAG: polymerase [Firmicutes bacterium]|nr:polymerase [Bacillota bacterium]